MCGAEGKPPRVAPVRALPGTFAPGGHCLWLNSGGTPERPSLQGAGKAPPGTTGPAVERLCHNK